MCQLDNFCEFEMSSDRRMYYEADVIYFYQLARQHSKIEATFVKTID